MWSTSAGGHLMKVVNLTGFTVLLKHTSNIRKKIYLLVAYVFSVKILFISLGKGHAILFLA